MAQFESTTHSALKDTHFIGSRTGIECGSLTEEEMTNLLKEDIAKANAIYMEMTVPDVARKNEERLRSEMTRAHGYAESKWKSEKRRNAYYEEIAAKYSNCYKPEPISSFEMHLGNECLGVCVIYPNDDFSFGNAFRHCVGNEYWNVATGWRICYASKPGTFMLSERACIELILDAETQQRKEMHNKEISDMIAEAHAEMTYNGD